jgi:hypothetical protein
MTAGQVGTFFTGYARAFSRGRYRAVPTTVWPCAMSIATSLAATVCVSI